jgi:endonuclease III related protein
MRAKKLELGALYKKLRGSFGFLDWWPGETRDEVVVGAILTQQASWTNVEKAISRMKEENALGLRKISKMDKKRLERLVYPTGFYRQKAKRLKGFASYVYQNYKGIDQMFGKDADELRKELLSLDGIGKETADSIMLYAAGKRIFVIDAYTKRIMSRIYGIDEGMEYDKLQRLIASSIKGDVDLYKDFHAQFVELGKNYCKTKPVCLECPVRQNCSYGASG